MAKHDRITSEGRFVGLIHKGNESRPVHECPHCYALVIGSRLDDHVEGCATRPSLEELRSRIVADQELAFNQVASTDIDGELVDPIEDD